MKAIRMHEPTGINGLVYEEVPDATPGLCDVLVKVAACGITHNELDWPDPWLLASASPRHNMSQGTRFTVTARPEAPTPAARYPRRSSPLCGCCQVVVRVFFEVGFDGEGVAALVPGRIVVPRSGSGLSEEPAFGV